MRGQAERRTIGQLEIAFGRVEHRRVVGGHAHVLDVRVQRGHLGLEWALVAEPAVRHRAIVAGARHRGERDHPPAVRRQKPRREVATAPESSPALRCDPTHPCAPRRREPRVGDKRKRALAREHGAAVERILGQDREQMPPERNPVAVPLRAAPAVDRLRLEHARAGLARIGGMVESPETCERGQACCLSGIAAAVARYSNAR